MKVVKTPVLKKSSYDLDWLAMGNGWDYWIRVSAIRKCFYLPKDFETVEIEFGTRQFPDRSGLAGKAVFIFDGDGNAENLFIEFDGLPTLTLDPEFDGLMKRLGVTDKPTRIYMRVLYTEKEK